MYESSSNPCMNPCINTHVNPCWAHSQSILIQFWIHVWVHDEPMYPFITHCESMYEFILNTCMNSFWMHSESMHESIMNRLWIHTDSMYESIMNPCVSLFWTYWESNVCVCLVACINTFWIHAVHPWIHVWIHSECVQISFERSRCSVRPGSTH